MGLNLCGAGAWNWLTAKLSGATGVTRTQKVKVKADVTGKVKCPSCNYEFDAVIKDATFEVEQQVAGGVVNFDVKPSSSSLSNLCAWKM